MEVLTDADGRRHGSEPMSFSRALRYLADLRSPVATPGLGRMRHLVELLGSPEREIPAIHVTGTNGKGSVSRLIEAALSGSGLRTGLYTSPHLEHVRERIIRNGEQIDEHTFAAGVERIRAVVKGWDDPRERPTHFEALTALGFLAFSAVPLDVLVLEAGVGGRNDATNVVDGTVAVVTNVELDHTDVLGSTRAEIAVEKAGIIKSGSTAVIGESDPGSLSIIEQRCREIGSAPWRFGHELLLRSDVANRNGRRIDVTTPFGQINGVEVPHHGRHQATNALLAIAAAEAFLGRPISREELDTSWARVENPGRFEIIDGSPTIVIDVAHNPHGIAALMETLQDRFPGRQRVVVVGINPHKDAEVMLQALQPECRTVITTEVADAPAVPAAVLAKIARALGFPDVRAEPIPAAAFAAALSVAGPGDIVVMTGSHYWIGEVRPRVTGSSSARAIG